MGVDCGLWYGKQIVHDLVAKTVTNSIKRSLVYSDKFVKGNTEMSYIHNGYLILDDRK